MNNARIKNDKGEDVCMLHYNNARQRSECAICMEQMTPNSSMKLACGHFFHKHCLERWADINESCPMCRTPIGIKNLLTINKNYIDLLGYMVFSLPKERRNAVISTIENIVAPQFDVQHSNT